MVSGQLHAPAALPPRKSPPSTHWIGDWVGPRTILDAVVKRKIPSPRWESNPGTPIVQFVAQRYTNWAFRPLTLIYIVFKYIPKRCLGKRLRTLRSYSGVAGPGRAIQRSLRPQQASRPASSAARYRILCICESGSTSWSALSYYSTHGHSVSHEFLLKTLLTKNRALAYANEYRPLEVAIFGNWNVDIRSWNGFPLHELEIQFTYHLIIYLHKSKLCLHCYWRSKLD
jgi:hypothetical protein